MLQYCTIISSEITKSQIDAFFQLGYWLQLVDDLKDKSKDVEKGIHTLATFIKNPAKYCYIVGREKSITMILLMKMDGVLKAKELLVDTLNNLI